MKRYLILFLVVVYPLLSGCATLSYTSPDGGEPVLLASDDESLSCKQVGVDNNWYLLFGMISLTEPDYFRFIRNPESSYRITRRVTPLDAAVTLGGGFLVSLTKDTIEVEECDGGNPPGSRVEGKRVVNNISSELHSYQRKITESRSVLDLPIIRLKSGEVYRGRILSSDVEHLVIGVPIKKQEVELPSVVVDNEKKDSPPSRSPIQFELKSGEILIGTIQSENDGNIVLQRGKEFIPLDRSDIVGRKELSKNLNQNRVETPLQLTWEERSIKQTEVESIILFPNDEEMEISSLSGGME